MPLFDPKFLNLEYLFNKILEILRAIYNFAISEAVTIFLLILSAFFLIVIIYSVVRVLELRKKEREKFARIVTTAPAQTPKSEKWETVLKHMSSENPADWRLAIIEADTMLDEMVQKMEYRGENLGERLKNIEQSDFTSINSAWEAHKVRNRIAHEGLAFQLTQLQARRVIGLYESVFREFNYI